MKIPEAQKMYRAYRQQLVDQSRTLYQQQEEAKKQFQMTGDTMFSKEAATLQLSIDATKKAFEENQEVLDRLAEQECTVFNAEVARQQADPVDGMAATMNKIMTTAIRMSRGDKVPYQDEKKLMEAEPDLYKMAKNAQMLMQQMKKKIKEHDSLWDEEGGEYDPEKAVAEAEAAGDLPEIPTDEIAMEENSTCT